MLRAVTSAKTDLDAEVLRIKEEAMGTHCFKRNPRQLLGFALMPERAEAQNHASSKDVITKSRDVGRLAQRAGRECKGEHLNMTRLADGLDL